MSDASDAQAMIVEECDAVKELLQGKNKAYGNSALDPVRVFSKSDPAEQIKVRLDDKLSRLQRGSAAGEDVVLDLIGYLVLLRIAQRMQLRDASKDAVREPPVSIVTPSAREREPLPQVDVPVHGALQLVRACDVDLPPTPGILGARVRVHEGSIPKDVAGRLYWVGDPRARDIKLEGDDHRQWFVEGSALLEVLPN